MGCSTTRDLITRECGRRQPGKLTLQSEETDGVCHKQAEKLGITPQEVRKEQSTINYRFRRDLGKKRKFPLWKKAMSGERHEPETSEPTGNASSSGGATMKEGTHWYSYLSSGRLCHEQG